MAVLAAQTNTPPTRLYRRMRKRIIDTYSTRRIRKRISNMTVTDTSSPAQKRPTLLRTWTRQCLILGQIAETVLLNDAVINRSHVVALHLSVINRPIHSVSREPIHHPLGSWKGKITIDPSTCWSRHVLLSMMAQSTSNICQLMA